MRKDNFSKVRIAEFLGRHIQVVHDTLHQLGSINPKRSTNAKFELSDSEWDGIEELRQAGISWNAIRLRMSIDVGPSPLALTFARRMKANNKPVPTTRKPPLVMSSTDLKDIADLREAGNEWLEIAKLQFKGYESPKRVRNAYLLQTSQSRPAPPPELTAVDLRKITRLRQATTHTAGEIASRHYPEWDRTAFWRAFDVKMIEEDAEPSSQNPYAQDAARLQQEIKSWLQIIKAKYPRLNVKTVTDQVFREIQEHENMVNSPKRGIGNFTMPAADYQDLARQREEGKRWDEIAELKYTGWSTDVVRKTFIKMTPDNGNRHRRTILGIPLKISAADCSDITRLRRQGKTWYEIGELKYPERNIDAIIRAYSRSVAKENERENGETGVGVWKRRGFFKATEADRQDVARLRREGKSWVKITELKFLGWSHYTIARHFRRR